MLPFDLDTVCRFAVNLSTVLGLTQMDNANVRDSIPQVPQWIRHSEARQQRRQELDALRECRAATYDIEQSRRTSNLVPVYGTGVIQHPPIDLGMLAAPPAPQPRPLVRQGAFYGVPPAPGQDPVVRGRDTRFDFIPSAPPQWNDAWGPVPTHDDLPPGTSWSAYLDGRYGDNESAIRAAVFLLFYFPRTDPRALYEPRYHHITPTANWRQQDGWEAGVAPVERELEPARADDAADSEPSPYDWDVDSDGDYGDDATFRLDDLVVQIHIGLARQETRAIIEAYNRSAPVPATPVGDRGKKRAIEDAEGPDSVRLSVRRRLNDHIAGGRPSLRRRAVRILMPRKAVSPQSLRRSNTTQPRTRPSSGAFSSANRGGSPSPSATADAGPSTSAQKRRREEDDEDIEMSAERPRRTPKRARRSRA